MKVFLDFEASSLSEHSYPIEVGWVFEDGRSGSHLIAPAPGWDDWSPISEGIHGIPRSTLERDGTPHRDVARRMVDVLADHALYASAPSWDGRWLSVLLRAAGLPRHALRLADTDDAMRETVADILRPLLPEAALKTEIHNIVARAGTAVEATPAHRALADAQGERAKWQHARDAALALAAATPRTA